MTLARWRLVLAAVGSLPAAAALALVAFIYGAHVYLTFRYEFLNPFSNAEEWAYTNIAANNFLRFGFLNSLFLQDFSPSPYPEDHPFAYNHMPAGPDNVTAVLLWLTGHDYQLTRFLFALAVLPGVYYYVRFAQLLLGRVALRGAPLVLFMTSPFVLISHFEAQIHSVYLLLGFAPLVWLIEYARGGARWRLPAAVVLLFILSIYVQYVLVAAIVFGLIFLWLLRVDELKFRHVAWGVGSVAAGVLLHLVQNFVYFGPELFFRELLYTLGNRTVGIPSKDELKDFYQSIGVVHHGSRSVDPAGYVKTILRNLRVPQWYWLAALLVALAATWWLRRRRTPSGDGASDERFPYIVRLYTWASVTVISVLLLFPAFAQEVNLGPYGVNHMLLGIPSLALIVAAIESGPRLSDLRRHASYRHYFAEGVLLTLLLFAYLGHAHIVWLVVFVALCAGSLLWTSEASGERQVNQSPRQFVSSIGIFLLAIGAATALVRGAIRDSIAIGAEFRRESYLEPLKELKQFRGRLFMTNINLPTAGFFAEAPGYGVCALEAVAADGRISADGCRVSYMRRHQYWRAQRPDYFFFFWNIRVFPGFADCMPTDTYLPVEVGPANCIGELRQRLQSRHPVVHRNELFEVYDLSALAGNRS